MLNGCNDFNGQCVDCVFRKPLVGVRAMKHCQYNRQRNAEDFIWENAGHIYMLVVDDIIDHSKIQELGVVDLYNKVEEFYLKVEELREIRYAGFDADTEIAKMVEKVEPLIDRLYQAIEDNGLI